MITQGLDSGLNIVLVGGGGGGSVIAEGIADAIEETGATANLTVITSIGDSGSKTGELRMMHGSSEYGGPAVGDLRKILGAVAGNEAGKLFTRRFGAEDDIVSLQRDNEVMLGILTMRGRVDVSRAAQVLDGEVVALGRELRGGLRGHVYGNLVLTALHINHGEHLTPAVDEAGRWLEARARVLPMTEDPHHLVMHDGQQTFYTEGRIDNHEVADPAVARIWLTPEPTITPEAFEALATGDVATCPSSLFTSLLPALGVNGVRQALSLQAENPCARRIFISNLVEETHATRGLNLAGYIKRLENATGQPFTHVIHNTNTSGIPWGKVPLTNRDNSLSQIEAKAIGVDLVDLHRPESDPNDPIAHLRATIHHNPRIVADALGIKAPQKAPGVELTPALRG